MTIDFYFENKNSMDSFLSRFLMRKFRESNYNHHCNRRNCRRFFRRIRSRTTDIGVIANYPRLIGYGFCGNENRGIKSRVHKVFSGTDLYPKSILFSSGDLSTENRDEIMHIFESKEIFVLKKDNSGQGNHVRPFSGKKQFEKILKRWKLNPKDNCIIQTIVKPYLISLKAPLVGNRKFDLRVHVLFVKQDKVYKTFYIPNTIVRFSAFEYSESDHKGFLTNTCQLPEFAKKEYKKYAMTLYNFTKNFDFSEGLLYPRLLHIIEETSKIYMEYMVEKDKVYFQNRRQPKNQIWISGFDVIFDYDMNPYLLEINGTPSLNGPPKGADPERTRDNDRMLDKFFQNFILPWSKGLNHKENDYFIKTFESEIFIH